MRVCVFGAGAVGGHMAARLVAAGGSTVSIVARGPQLAAIREGGIWVDSGGERLGGAPTAATDDPGSLPPQDIVFVTLKSMSVPPMADALARLVAPDGVAVFFLNGIPWWWRHATASPGPLSRVDPEGALWHRFGPQRALGGVLYSGNEVVRPGLVNHRGSNNWPLGEPDGTLSERAVRVADLLKAAGLAARVVPDIRTEVLKKLARNVCGNPISALTRNAGWTNAVDTGINDVGRAMIEEMLAVGLAQGIDIRGDVDAAELVKPEGRVGGKSSMLQDALQGRPVEAEAILGQLQAFGRETGVPTPTIDVVCALLRCLDLSLRGVETA